MKQPTPITDMAFAERVNYANTEEWLMSLRTRFETVERALQEIALVEPQPANTLAWDLVLTAREVCGTRRSDSEGDRNV